MPSFAGILKGFTRGILFLLFFAIHFAAHAASVTLEWDANTEPDLAGYRVRFGTAPGQYSHTANAGILTRATLTELADGTPYYFVVIAYNTAGLESAPSNEVSFTSGSMGNQPPEISLTSPVAGQAFSAPTTINLQASATDPDGSIARVDFYNGPAKIGEVATAPFVFAWTNVAPGTYTLTARAFDNLGTASTSTAVSISVTEPPNSAPQVAFLAPTAGSVFAEPANINLSVNASDADGTIQKVQFFRNGTLIGERLTAPYALTWNNAPSGTYVLTAVATDDRGATTTTAPLNVIVDTLPVVSLTTSGASLIAPASLTLTATASDEDGTIARVEFFQGSTKIGTTTVAPYTLNWSNVAAGSYSLTAVAFDDAGLSATSAAVAVIVAPANQPPTVAVTSPAANSDFVAPATIVLSASAADPDGTIAKVEFFNGSTKIGERLAAPYTWSWSPVAAGAYVVRAIATDDRGGTAASADVTVTVSAPNIAPTVALTSPQTGSSFFTPASLDLSAAASDADGSIARVEFYSGSAKLGEAASAPFTLTWSSVPAGPHTLTAVAIDNQGLAATSAPVAITISTPNQPPSIAFTTPEAGALLAAPANVEIAVNATDVDGSIDKVEFFSGTTKIGERLSAPFAVTWPNVPAGTYSLSAVATDDRGASTSTAPRSILVNAPPQLAVSATAASFTAPSSIEISATAADADGTIQRVEFYDGIAKVGESTAAPFGCTLASVPAGPHSIWALAIDDRGTTTASQAILITLAAPNQPPTVVITSPLSGQLLASPVTISADAVDPDGTIARVDFFAGSTLIGSRAAAPFVCDWSTAPLGTHILSVVAYDDKGASTASAPVEVQLNAPPLISATADVSAVPTGGSVTVTARVSDPSRPLRRVEFWAGSILLGKDITDSYQFTWRNPPPGIYAITSVAVEVSGSRTPSQPITVEVAAHEQPARRASSVPGIRAGRHNEYGEFELMISGNEGEIYDVWCSDDLKEWSLLVSVWNADGALVVEDAGAETRDSRFYRVSPH